VKKVQRLLNGLLKCIKPKVYFPYIAFIIPFLTVLGFTITSQARTNDDSYNNFQSTINKSMGQDPNLTNTYDSPYLSTSMLNVNGPFQVSVNWSDIYGATLETHYANLLSDTNAIAIEGNLGAMQNRMNVTLGHVFSPKNRVKITAERLAQKQTFDFYSGSIDEWVSQYAGGAELQHLISNGFFNNISAGGYYARSGSKSLDPILYYEGDTQFINYRHIAGATSTGGHISFGLKPWKTSMLTLTSYYDSVNYDALYSDVSAEDSSSLGYGVALEQYISHAMKATAEYSHRALYNTIQTGVQFFHNIRHNSAAVGMSLGYSHNNYNDTNSDDTDSENMYTVGLQYYFMPIKSGYTMPKFNFQSLTAWTSEPAVRMDKVMAAADQEKQAVDLKWTNTVTNTSLADKQERLISWTTDASSNAPNSSIGYALKVEPLTPGDTFTVYTQDVTGTGNSAIIKKLTVGDTYKTTITVTDAASQKSASGETTFTAGSDQTVYPWDPKITPSQSASYPENAIILEFPSPTRAYDTTDYSSKVTYTVTLSNPNESSDTHTYTLDDSSSAGSTIKLDTYLNSQQADLQAGVTYTIDMKAADSNQNDTIDVTNNKYTCTTQGTRKEIDWPSDAVQITAYEDDSNKGNHTVSIYWNDDPAILSDAASTNDTVKYSYVVKPQYCYYDHNDNGSKTKVCMNNNMQQTGETASTDPSIKDFGDTDGQYASHFLNKITVQVIAKAYNGDTEDTAYPSKTENNEWLNPDYN
jgi:hypothetical protein